MRKLPERWMLLKKIRFFFYFRNPFAENYGMIVGVFANKYIY